MKASKGTMNLRPRKRRSSAVQAEPTTSPTTSATPRKTRRVSRSKRRRVALPTVTEDAPAVSVALLDQMMRNRFLEGNRRTATEDAPAVAVRDREEEETALLDQMMRNRFLGNRRTATRRRVSEKDMVATTSQTNTKPKETEERRLDETTAIGATHDGPAEPVVVTTTLPEDVLTPRKLQRRSSYTEHGHVTVALKKSSVCAILLVELALVAFWSLYQDMPLDASQYSFWLILVPVILSILPMATRRHIPFVTARKPSHRLFPHVIPPPHVSQHEPHDESVLTEMTLRDFLVHPDGFHLGLAPAFFGFYAYFGALTAFDEHVVLPETTDDKTSKRTCLESQILSVAGASAGAMSAVLLAAGIAPRRAAEFCRTVTLRKFADPPAIGAAFKGHLFEELMQAFMEQEKPGHSLRLEDGQIPVAVSAFDIKTMKEHLLRRGSMAKAARSSATFPLLFQPCKWQEDEKSASSASWFIDGGVTDLCGLNGLAVSHPQASKRIVNLVVGDFPRGRAPAPSSMPRGVQASEVLSISIRNTPQCGPWAMENGPKAQEAARKVMVAALDLPLYKGKEPGHYELHLDATSFVPS